MRRVGLVVVIVAALCGLVIGNADAGLCGKTIIKNLTLHSDLHCGHAGLIVGADNVVVNLNHFTIFGRVNGFDGINVQDWTNVTIKNGAVSHFQNGIVFDGATNGFIKHVSVVTGGGSGIILKLGADGNQLTSDLIKAFNGHGVLINASSFNTLTSVAAKKNSGQGIDVQSGDGTTLTNVQARHNEGQGILLDFGSTGTTVDGAIATTNGGSGVNITTTDNGSEVLNSTSNNNQGYGFIANNTSQDGGGNSATGNLADPNQQCINVDCA